MCAAALVAASLALSGGAAGSVAAAPRVTVVADSVGGVLFWQRDARDELGRGVELRIEIRTCRRLATPGCSYDGVRPPSVLDAVEELGRELGHVVVVDVGYNDSPTGYGAALDDVMQALADAGVERVVWVTLRELRPAWKAINDQIRSAGGRWPQLVVADWQRESEQHDEWFADGIHMNYDGGTAFARFLRPIVLEACGQACGPAGTMLGVATRRLRTATAERRYEALLVAHGGTPPYRWTVRGLPRGLRMTPGGTVTGRPHGAGRYLLAVDVVDDAGISNRAVVALRVAVRPP
jgi:hypothetical protein